MMEAARTSETSVDNHFTRQYNPEDSSEHHTRLRENLKSHSFAVCCKTGGVSSCDYAGDAGDVGSYRRVINYDNYEKQ
jgi:hypothetical protein